MIDHRKEKIQIEAVDAWIKNDNVGTVEVATGHGKTFIAFRCILTMPKKSNVLFLAETQVREKTIREDVTQYKKFYGKDPLAGHNVKFGLYQSAHKYKLEDWFPNKNPTIVIMDEIHDSISEVYLNFAKNNLFGTNIARLGLSATIDRKSKYIIQGTETTKFKVLEQFCPIVYTYGLQDSLDNKTTRDLRFFIVTHQLDNSGKNIKGGSKAVPFMQSEQAAYSYLDKEFKQSMFRKYKSETEKTFAIRGAASRRARLLYSLPSKIRECRKLVSHLQDKTLVFGLDSKTLLSICPTAIVEENDNWEKDLEDFKSGKTLLGASNKMLKQGENIPGLKTVVFLAYYSKPKDFQQVVGRGTRGKDVGNIIIFVTDGTQEQSWFKSMTEGMNVPFIYCSSVEHLLKQL